MTPKEASDIMETLLSNPEVWFGVTGLGMALWTYSVIRMVSEHHERDRSAELDEFVDLVQMAGGDEKLLWRMEQYAKLACGDFDAKLSRGVG